MNINIEPLLLLSAGLVGVASFIAFVIWDPDKMAPNLWAKIGVALVGAIFITAAWIGGVVAFYKGPPLFGVPVCSEGQPNAEVPTCIVDR